MLLRKQLSHIIQVVFLKKWKSCLNFHEMFANEIFSPVYFSFGRGWGVNLKTCTIKIGWNIKFSWSYKTLNSI